ncbi:ChaN family lipoprotein [Desulfosediminicola flagellatus]|uniref:ChaN family lipoprotein n=1 Tax=Desulfosediminicola flagellatus TaxID=2569541 RepID=UPI0010AD325A|nr:ChaN family lipoprotein [Desulfosediminicola flagellatus]
MILTGKIAFYFALSIFFLAIPNTGRSADGPDTSAATYQLALAFDIPHKQLTATARISIPAGETLSLHTGELKITGILLKRQDGGSNEIASPQGVRLIIPADRFYRELFISYDATFENNSSNLISNAGITLIDSWHPIPDKKMVFSLDATIPEGFEAICESDSFPLRRVGNTVTATFSEPSYALHFAAAPYTINTVKVRAGLNIHSMFFPEEANLADDYLKKAKTYINTYEAQIGPFPYNHYVIVANRLPTGLGMPTFTLLGQAVLRLPFIKDTSLRHEILHSWFGNSIDVGMEYGNWCEALTSYLADHAYREELGDARLYRKESLINYFSYVHESNIIPLSSFTSASHTQQMSRSRRAVGYSRGLMLFSELETRVGQETFSAAVRSFFSEFNGKSASWHDFIAIFNTVSDTDLTDFFQERLSRTDTPNVYADNVVVSQDTGQTFLNFTLHQTTDTPFSLHIPVKVVTLSGAHDFTVITKTAETTVRLPLPGRPLQFYLDPDYTIMRQLTLEELPPVWSRFMGAENPLILFESQEAQSIYQPLLEVLEITEENIRAGNSVKNSELRDKDLLILGLNQTAAHTLFGDPVHPENGFTLDVRQNPLNPDHVAVLVTSSGLNQTTAVASRLTHYGKYSYLSFTNGRNTSKDIAPSATGLEYILEQLPQGGATSHLNSFDAIVDELAKNDVIYIGETHDSVSDHRLQLRLIEALSQKTPNIAIGMEMFPYTSQESLDKYVLEDQSMSEKEFLKKSDYFKVWRYNYRFFRDIFQIAKKEKLPVIGLNLNRDIVSTVYKSGSTDELTEEEQNALPKERNLDMPGYAERLRSMHSIHQEGNHGNGLASGFIQAQALWDETMAQNIIKHLQDNPGQKMVVLAGSQHTRKDSGIPPRVARRINVQQASVLNILNGSAPVNLSKVADYFFLVEHMPAEEDPKIGIVLNERTDENEGENSIEIIDFSPHSKAQEAGLQKGDILVSLNGYPISTMEDIRIAMVDTASDSTIEVKVVRGEKEKMSEIRVQVKPLQMTSEKPHP